jgi:hypothetical protein
MMARRLKRASYRDGPNKPKICKKIIINFSQPGDILQNRTAASLNSRQPAAAPSPAVLVTLSLTLR